MTHDILNAYDGRVASGELQSDVAQRNAAQRLNLLVAELENWRKAESSLKRLLGARSTAPKGLYIHGSVGRGKTMLMDMFHNAVRIKRKRRAHFHEFMADVHERIGQARKKVEGDPIPRVAKELAQQANLLCFDELHVTDIADAMILGRLFKVLFETDAIVVATSNAHPSELYKNGLNRQLFLPFIDLIGQNMEVLELDAVKDFRLEKLSGRRLYFSPLDHHADTAMDMLWVEMTNGTVSNGNSLEVKGRKIDVPQAAMGVARFDFADLCAKPLGSLDYLAIARAFHTVMIDRIPILTPARRNEARRFINLIDTLYDNRIGLVASAAAEPDDIYPAGDGADLFERTASRLIEMRSEDYIKGRAERHGVQSAEHATSS